MSVVLVPCSFCQKNFFKDLRHVNENRRLGHNFYCSLNCQSAFKTNQLQLVCENPKCNTPFHRVPDKRSHRHFCSQSCSAQFNNLGKVHGPSRTIKFCRICQKEIRKDHSYCSIKCWAGAHEISQEDVLMGIKELAEKLGRAPTGRESKCRTSAIKRFGSWNKALIAAGLTPHRSLNQKMYKRKVCIAKDGHKCNSISEQIIDNWLFEHGIEHQKEFPYPLGKYVTDWALSKFVFIEYFGLAKDSRRYDQEMAKKRALCFSLGIRLIELVASDLFPKNRLEEKLAYLVTN